MNNQDVFILLILATIGPSTTNALDEEVPSKNVSSVESDGRFIIQGSDYTINFLPFFILIKIAFILGEWIYA